MRLPRRIGGLVMVWIISSFSLLSHPFHNVLYPSPYLSIHTPTITFPSFIHAYVTLCVFFACLQILQRILFFDRDRFSHIVYFDDHVVGYLDQYGRERVYIRGTGLLQSNSNTHSVNLDVPSQTSQSNDTALNQTFQSNEHDTSSSADRGSTLNEMLLVLDGCKRGGKLQSNLPRPQSNQPSQSLSNFPRPPAANEEPHTVK